MEEESSQVKLHGFWASPFVYRVRSALKLKNIEYKYIEEDLFNKSPSLLQYNPVHKTVPVLIHGEKSIAESNVILEYIEETWPDHQAALLPSDPYQKSMARFWMDFGEKQHSTIGMLMLSSEENREEAAKHVVEMLKTVQDRALGDKRFFGGDMIGLVDLSFGWLAIWIELIQELVGVRVLEPSTLPELHRWIVDFKQEPVIQETQLDVEALLAQLESVRKRLTSPTNT